MAATGLYVGVVVGDGSGDDVVEGGGGGGTRLGTMVLTKLTLSLTGSS